MGKSLNKLPIGGISDSEVARNFRRVSEWGADIDKLVAGNFTSSGSGGGSTIIVPSGSVPPVNLLDGARQQDTAATTVTRGMVIVGNSTPKWVGLPAPGAAAVFIFNGLDPVWQIGSYQNKLLDGNNHTDTDGAALPTKGDMIVNSGSLWTTVSLAAATDIFLRQSGGLPVWMENLCKSGAAQVDVPNRGSNITTTNLVAAGHTRAMYRVSVIGEDTSADITATGVLQVTIGWTDDVGATTQNAFTTTLPLNALGRAAGTILLYSTGAAAITYAATVTGTFGTALFTLRIRVEQVG